MEEEYKVQVGKYIAFVEEKKECRFRALADYARPGKILFLGDSLTEEFPVRELLPEFFIYNRGYGGDTTRQLLERLPYSCYPYAPKAVFVQAGTNDLAQGQACEQIVRNIREIRAAIGKHCPGAEIFHVSLCPMNASSEKFRRRITFGAVRMRTNEQIRATNLALEKFCRENDFSYVNVFDALTDGNGELEEAFSSDGLHLTVRGYAAAAEILFPYLEKIEKI